MMTWHPFKDTMVYTLRSIDLGYDIIIFLNISKAYIENLIIKWVITIQYYNFNIFIRRLKMIESNFINL